MGDRLSTLDASGIIVGLKSDVMGELFVIVRVVTRNAEAIVAALTGRSCQGSVFAERSRPG